MSSMDDKCVIDNKNQYTISDVNLKNVTDNKGLEYEAINWDNVPGIKPKNVHDKYNNGPKYAVINWDEFMFGCLPKKSTQCCGINYDDNDNNNDDVALDKIIIKNDIIEYINSTSKSDDDIIDYLTKRITHYCNINYDTTYKIFLEEIIPILINEENKMLTLNRLIKIFNKMKRYLLNDCILFNVFRYNDYDVLTLLCSDMEELNGYFIFLRTYIHKECILSLFDVCYNYAYYILNDKSDGLYNYFKIHPEMFKTILRYKMDKLATEYNNKPNELKNAIEELHNLKNMDDIFDDDLPINNDQINTKYVYEVLNVYGKIVIVGSISALKVLLSTENNDTTFHCQLLSVAQRYNNYEMIRYLTNFIYKN